MRPVLCILAAWALIATASAAASAAAPPAPLPRESAYQLEVQLVDQLGQRFDWRSRRGKVQLVSMFYTSCPYICPLIVDSGKAIERQLSPAERQRLGILLISMDPKRDTPAALGLVAGKRKLAPALWTLASPAPGDVRSIAAVLGIRYRELADGEFNHTSALVLLDAEGRVLARSDRMGSQPDPAFVAAVRTAIAAHGPVTPGPKKP